MKHRSGRGGVEVVPANGDGEWLAGANACISRERRKSESGRWARACAAAEAESESLYQEEFEQLLMKKEWINEILTKYPIKEWKTEYLGIKPQTIKLKQDDPECCISTEWTDFQDEIP
ncbi:hypothetical protein Tco_1082155 [Tanacetum coccineum]|uniref:Uncharacterized protein n=1 Tax=Tanacetum coccineum TaxID=301880 RepID=A0ABQ5HZP3_9ASTR